MSKDVIYIGSKIEKIKVLKAIAKGLQQLSIDIDEESEPIYTYNTKITNNKIKVECTDGTKIELLLKRLE